MNMRLQTTLGLIAISGAIPQLSSIAVAQTPTVIEYRVLATNKTSTMQREMQEAAEAGFRFGDVMGGDTAFGGSEVVVIMVKDGQAGKFGYRLLATNKTSTMQKEMQEAGDEGYEYRGQTVFKSLAEKKSSSFWSERKSRNRSSNTSIDSSRPRRHQRCRRSWVTPGSRDSTSSE